MNKLKVGALALSCALALSVGGLRAGRRERGEPYGIATTSMAVCQILDRLEIDEVVGIPNAAEDIDLPARYEGVRTIGNAMTPDMEILSQINPEVVIVPRTLEAGLSEQFDNAGIEAMYFDPLERRGACTTTSTRSAHCTGARSRPRRCGAEYESYVAENSIKTDDPPTHRAHPDGVPGAVLSYRDGRFVRRQPHRARGRRGRL